MRSWTPSTCERRALPARYPKPPAGPATRPRTCSKLYIYGYLNRVRSSRRLEAEAGRSLEVIWLLRRLRPDFKTIADFRRHNRHAFRPVFAAFLDLCRRLGLFGRELIAVDGTRIKAVNNQERNFTRATLTRAIGEADARLVDYLQRAGSDAGEVGASGSRRPTLPRGSPPCVNGASGTPPCWSNWSARGRTSSP